MSEKEPKHSSLQIELGEVSVRFEGDHSFIISGGLVKVLGEAVALSKNVALPVSRQRLETEKTESPSSGQKPSFKSFLATKDTSKISNIFIYAAFYLRHFGEKESFNQKELRQLMKTGGEPYHKHHNTIEKVTKTYINRLIKQGKFIENSDQSISLANASYESIRPHLNG